MKTTIQTYLAGTAMLAKVRQQVRESGARRAAANMRKQGYPLSLALALIAERLPR